MMIVSAPDVWQVLNHSPTSLTPASLSDEPFAAK
jgi:hypothetical protein